MTARLLLLALLGGALLYAASFLLRCRHRHEVLHFAEVGQRTGLRVPNPADAGSTPAFGTKMARVSPDGNAGDLRVEPGARPRAMLYCPDCRRVRPHPWAGEPARFHRTYGPRVETLAPTGINRMAADTAQEAADVDAAIASLEKQQRYAEIGARVRRKRFQVVGGNGGVA